MSDRRRQLFQFNKEWVETSAVDAAKRRGEEPFVILVMDLDDPTGFKMAAGLAGQEVAEKRRSDCAANNSSAVLTYDATVAAIDPMFPTSTGWATIRDAQLPSNVFRVVLIGDGGFSFITHKLP